MKPFEASFRSVGSETKAVDLCGYLDADTIHQLEDLLTANVTPETSRLIVCMDGLSYISSAGIGTLMGWTARLRSRGGDLILARPSDKITKILDLLGFTRIFRIVEDEEQALDDI